MQTILAQPENTSSDTFSAVHTGNFAPITAGENGHGNRALVDALVNSKIYREYERAFSDLTGLPGALQPVETWQLPHHGKRNENEFCAMLSRKSRACAACLQTQERLCQQAAADQGNTVLCPVGLSDSAVPVRMSDRLVGYLQIGQVFRKKTDRSAIQESLFPLRKMGSRRES
jgi:ligand-binding sensor protein